MSLRAWCPECAEEVVATAAGLCVWCDAPVRERQPSKKGKPFGVYGKLTDAQVRAVHATLYEGQRLSLRACGERIYEAAGFASPRAAANALHQQFGRLGLRVRSRVEANTKHGRARRVGRDPAYQREGKVRRGEVLERPRCVGVRTWHPRRGKQCQNVAQTGSDYCWAHDPERAAERDAHMARMRAEEAA